MNKGYKGILNQSYLFLISNNKKVRNLNKISFRILNFIIYSNIYFCYKIGFLKLEEINKNKIVPIKEKPYEGKFDRYNCSYNIYRVILLENRKKGIKNENDIIEILNTSWNLLVRAIKEENIDNAQIFINMLFNDLFKLIINSEGMNTIEQREKFEDNINNIVNEAINNYKTNSQKYLKVIDKIKVNNLEKIYIVLENENIIKEAENEFPYYYELLSIPLVQEKHLKEIVLNTIENANIKYPVLYYFLKEDKNYITYLHTFPDINNFVNSTI